MVVGGSKVMLIIHCGAVLYRHRRRIKTEEKAKVGASVWGKESIQFLAVLAILHKDDLNNKMNCTRMI